MLLWTFELALPILENRLQCFYQLKSIIRFISPAASRMRFLALTENVQFIYKCSDFYMLEDEHGVAWNVPALNISWGVT